MVAGGGRTAGCDEFPPSWISGGWGGPCKDCCCCFSAAGAAAITRPSDGRVDGAGGVGADCRLGSVTVAGGSSVGDAAFGEVVVPASC